MFLVTLVFIFVYTTCVTCQSHHVLPDTRLEEAKESAITEALNSCKEGGFDVRIDPTGTSCIICRCINGDWVCESELVPADMCCAKYGILCDGDVLQCDGEEFQLQVMDDYCVECRCINGFWVCTQYLNKFECCAKYQKLCDCTHGETFMDVLPNNEGCFKCHCNHGFWECLEPIYTPGECCEMFDMQQFCNYTCEDGDVNVVEEKDHCVVCICEGGHWVCTTQLSPEECCEKYNIHCEEECCVPRTMTIKLKKKVPKVVNAVDGITLEELGHGDDNPLCDDNKCLCSSTAIIKASFDKILPLQGCVTEPLCRKRMLRIDLMLNSDIIEGHHTDIGDSITNNGFGGDANTQENDAEAHGVGVDLRLYKSDKCSTAYEVLGGIFSNQTSLVTIWISNEYIRVRTDDEIDLKRCDKCLYALNGQSDSGPLGTPNEDIYIALNRVVSGGRYGRGICRAKIRWVCPCKKSDWMDFVKQKKHIDTASDVTANTETSKA